MGDSVRDQFGRGLAFIGQGWWPIARDSFADPSPSWVAIMS
jgi:hypothetical protein